MLINLLTLRTWSPSFDNYNQERIYFIIKSSVDIIFISKMNLRFSPFVVTKHIHNFVNNLCYLLSLSVINNQNGWIPSAASYWEILWHVSQPSPPTSQAFNRNYTVKWVVTRWSRSQVSLKDHDSFCCWRKVVVATPTTLSTHRPTHLLTCCHGIDTMTGATSVYLFRSHPKDLWPTAMYLLQVVSQESIPQLFSS